ncbi:hypothetical protein ACB092_02G186500 [Castanea dentata]
MVAVFTKELLSWYLITVKLGEAVESGVATTSTTSPTIEFPEQTQHSLQKHKRRLRQMDRHKWCALQHVLKRTNHDINLYLDAVNELEERARACYEGPSITSLGSNEFVEMIVLDGSFVIELFRGADEGFKQLGYPRNDPIFAMRGSMHSIQQDMIMLENQLPLFILDRLLGLQLGNPDHKGLVAKLELQFFDPLMPIDEPLTKSYRSKLESSFRYATTFDPLSDHGGLHCVDVFRQKAGIEFKKRMTNYFWDIKFKNGILHMMWLTFHYHGIIEHWLGSDAEVANLFNCLCQEVVFDINDSYLSYLSEDANRYYDHKWNAWCAIVVVFFLLITFTQTFYGVYGYYRPS